MKTYKFYFITILVFYISCIFPSCQTENKNLIIGKWKYIKTKVGQDEKHVVLSGEPIYTFQKDGRWFSEANNMNKKEVGTWSLDNKKLIISSMEDSGQNEKPITMDILKIDKQELIFSIQLKEPFNMESKAIKYFKRID